MLARYNYLFWYDSITHIDIYYMNIIFSNSFSIILHEYYIVLIFFFMQNNFVHDMQQYSVQHNLFPQLGLILCVTKCMVNATNIIQ